MKKEEIIRVFLKEGYNLHPKTLTFLEKNQSLIKPAIQKLKENNFKKEILELEDIQNLLEDNKRIKIIKKPILRDKRIKIEDVLDYFTEYFEKIKSFFGRRFELINPLSINKISTSTKKFSIIGMVKEVDEEWIVVEDLTGTIKLRKGKSIKNLEINEDDVLGFVCEKKDDKLLIDNIIFPDIPLRKQINHTKEEIYFLFSTIPSKKWRVKWASKISKLLEKMKDKKLYILLFLDEESDKNVISLNYLNHFLIPITKEKTTPTTPLFVEIEGLNFLFLSKKDFIKESVGKDELIYILKKRRIPFFNHPYILYSNNPFIIDPIPDIVCVSDIGKNLSFNYKGTTILMIDNFIDKPICWLINLKTRECLKINLV